MRLPPLAPTRAALPSLALLALLAAAAPAASAPGDSLPPVRSTRLSAPVDMDGELDDGAWRTPPTITRLTQSEPFEGQAPTESTWVWVAHDDEALYVAARCWDSRPDSIVASLVRRDLMVASDRIVVYLDPFRDLRGGAFFSVSAAGVLWDGTLFNDVDSDDSWDGVWHAHARRFPAADGRPGGWTAEMRIPFSQLRYRPGERQEWGFNVRRRLERRSELDQLAWTPRRGTGFVSRFPRLVGIENGHRARSVELLPYTTGKGEFLAHPPGDPFHDGGRFTPAAGADLRMSMGNQMTLNATLNPDFGQVEVDPAVVNLSDVESYFVEKRPFFTENSRVFAFGQEGANSYWNFTWPAPTFFYSRRIGRAPQGGVPAGAPYRDVPLATHILGAAKLTGKPAAGFDFGTLHAVTSTEHARWEMDGVRRRTQVEPLTYYGVARGLKSLGGGAHGLGFLGTLVQRRLDGDGLGGLLSRQSATAGVDGWHFLDRDRGWVLSGWAAASRVAGSPERLVALQRSPTHYLQRPDADALGVDSAATAMTGWGARLWLNKEKGLWRSNLALGALSPRFDVNDIGFQRQADVINGHVTLRRHFPTPGRWKREAWVTAAVFRVYDFDRNLTALGYWTSTNTVFANDHTLDTEFNYVPFAWNNRRTRGGPLMAEPAGTYAGLTYATADRKRVAFELFADRLYTPAANQTDFWTVAPSVTWKPVSSFSATVGPRLAVAQEEAQYLRRVYAPGEVPADFGGYRYVFARMDQTTVSADIRLDVSFTANLTLQTYLQPLVSAGRFTDVKELARSRSFDFHHYGDRYDPATGTVSPAGGTPFALPAPDFNFKSLRGNVVLRWEYRPGSVLYAVWTQLREDLEPLGSLRFGPSVRRLVDADADQVFLLKATVYLDL